MPHDCDSLWRLRYCDTTSRPAVGGWMSDSYMRGVWIQPLHFASRLLESSVIFSQEFQVTQQADLWPLKDQYTVARPQWFQQLINGFTHLPHPTSTSPVTPPPTYLSSPLVSLFLTHLASRWILPTRKKNQFLATLLLSRRSLHGSNRDGVIPK